MNREEAREQARDQWRLALAWAQQQRRPLWRRVRDWLESNVVDPAELRWGALVCRFRGCLPAEDLNAPSGLPILDLILPTTPLWHCPRCYESLPEPEG